MLDAVQVRSGQMSCICAMHGVTNTQVPHSQRGFLESLARIGLATSYGYHAGRLNIMRYKDMYGARA